MAQRIHVTELLDEILRLMEVNLKSSLDLKGVYRGDLSFIATDGVKDMVNGIWVNAEPQTRIEPIQLPTDLMVHYGFRLVYLRRIESLGNENVVKQKEQDVKSVIDMVMDNFTMSALSLTNGQVLWWMPTEVEWEPPEDGYVSEIASDIVAVAFMTECKVRTRR